jgi:hypothetical protein
MIAIAQERMHEEARAALRCFERGSALGVRHHLVLLRRRADRRAQLERRLWHASTTAAELRRATDAALHALDHHSPASIVRALERVELLAR